MQKTLHNQNYKMAAISDRCDHLEKENHAVHEKLNMYNEKNKKQEDKVKKLDTENTNLRKQLTNSMKKSSSFQKEMDEVKSNIKSHAKDMLNLKSFAEYISHLHISLSDWTYYEDYCGYSWDPLYMDTTRCKEKEEVKSWSQLVEKVGKGNGCVYLDGLKKAIESYQQFIFSDKWADRLRSRYRRLEEGVLRNGFLKLYSPTEFNLNAISVELCPSFDYFSQVTKELKWCRHSSMSASCLDEDEKVLFVAVYDEAFGDYDHDVHPFNWTNDQGTLEQYAATWMTTVVFDTLARFVLRCFCCKLLHSFSIFFLSTFIYFCCSNLDY